MKQIIIILCFFATLLGISSCGQSHENTFTEVNDQNLYLSGTKEEVIRPQITWTGEIIFGICESIANEQSNFLTGELAVLQKNLQNYTNSTGRSSTTWTPRMGYFVREYCKSDDGKYIFFSDDKAPRSLGRYDATSQVIEEARWNHSYLKYFPGYKNSFQGRSGSIIWIKGNIENYRDQAAYIFIKNPLQEKNQRFCKSGLLQNGNPSECSIDILFQYDYIKNDLREHSFCSFYKDEQGVRKPLERCLIINSSGNK